MYKVASRNMQHANGVDRPHPARGFLDGDFADDLILTASNMGREDCLREKQMLMAEAAKAQNELNCAKRDRNSKDADLIGLKLAAFNNRVAAINLRLEELRTAEDPSEALSQAIDEILDGVTAKKIKLRAREIHRAKWRAA